MPVQHLKASALVKKQWGAFCCECGKNAADATDDAADAARTAAQKLTD